MDTVEKYAAYCYAKQKLEDAKKDVESYELLSKGLKIAYESGAITINEYMDRIEELSERTQESRNELFKAFRAISKMTEGDKES